MYKTDCKNNIIYTDASHMLKFLQGVWEGTWCGYEVEFTAHGTKYMLRTVEGIRGISKCVVDISQEGKCTVTA